MTSQELATITSTDQELIEYLIVNDAFDIDENNEVINNGLTNFLIKLLRINYAGDILDEKQKEDINYLIKNNPNIAEYVNFFISLIEDYSILNSQDVKQGLKEISEGNMSAA